jgi:hypothetical protein
MPANRGRALLATGLLLAVAIGLLPTLGCGRKKSVTAPEAPPVCEVTPLSLDFGSQALGGPGDTLAFTVKNVGGGTLKADVGGVCGTFLVACGCGHLSLPAGDSQSVLVRFAPTKLGSTSCTFAIGDSGDCPGVTCTGTAIRAGTCWLTATNLAFGDIRVDSCSAEQSFTIRNSGEAVLAGAVPDSAGPFQVTTGAGPFAIPSGESHSVSVRYCPGREGSSSADLQLGTSACVVHCTGSAYVPPPACNVSVTTIEFGTVLVGSCSERPIRIANLGATPLTGTIPSVCGVFQVVSGAGDYVLAPGESRYITVRFCPTAGNRYNCQLSLGTSCASVALVGSGGCHASLAIVSSPSGARITFDGTTLTTVSPCTLSVGQGSHTITLNKTGYAYFDGPSPVVIPCTGAVTASFVGHHRTTYMVDNGTLLDPANPTANHCRDSTYTLGPGGANGPTLLLFSSLLGSPDSRVSVVSATLTMRCLDCSGPDAPVGLVAYPAATPWTACAATWASPGATWGGGDVSASADKWAEYFRLDVTAAVSHFLSGATVNRGWAVVPSETTFTHRIASPLDPSRYPTVTMDWIDR